MNILLLIILLVGAFVFCQRVGLNLVESPGTALGWKGLGAQYNQNDVRSGDLKVQPG